MPANLTEGFAAAKSPAGKALKYVYDINSTLVARPAFGRVAEVLGRTNADGFNVFAHSMGSFLTMEGILQLDLQDKFNNRGRLKTIILASPDIDIDLFESQLELMKIDKSKIYVLVSEDDSALWFSRFLSGGIRFDAGKCRAFARRFAWSAEIGRAHV